MTEYRHLILEGREKLIILKNQCHKQADIAKEIGFSQCVIAREPKRNRSQTTKLYNPEIAQNKAMLREKRGCKIDKNQELKNCILEKLELNWSPDVISNRLTLENDQSYMTLLTK